MAGLAWLGHIVVVVSVQTFALCYIRVQKPLVVGGAVGALVPVASSTNLAAVVAGQAVLVGGGGVVLEEAHAEGTACVEEVGSGVEEPVPCDFAGCTIGQIEAGVAGGLAGLAVLRTWGCTCRDCWWSRPPFAWQHRNWNTNPHGCMSNTDNSSVQTARPDCRTTSVCTHSWC